MAGILAAFPKLILNTIYYDSGFLGKIVLSPITEELFKAAFLLSILHHNFKKGNEYNIMLVSIWVLYSFGLFTGLGFGVYESITAYNILNKPSLLLPRFFATILHMCTTFISGIGLTKYITTNQRAYISTIIPAIILHAWWNYVMNYSP